MRKIDYPCKAVYRALIPDQAVGTDLDYFSIFNGSAVSNGHTEVKVIVAAVKVIVAGDTTSGAAVGINLHLHKTTAIGTGGTLFTRDGTANTAATFTSLVGSTTGLPANLTGRYIPTGGATVGIWLSQVSVFTEETGVGGTYLEKWLHHYESEAIVLNPGQGLLVKQGSVAGDGDVGFIVEFGIIQG